MDKGRSEAEIAFFAFLEQGDRSDAAFEACCAGRPELVSELRRLHRAWSDIEPFLATLLGDPERSLSLSRVLGAREQPSLACPTLAPGLPPRGADVVRRLLEPGDRYRDELLIDQGGMGVVSSLWDETLQRHIARKVMRVNVDEAGARERFLDEALVTAQLDHPGIVPVHEIGLDAGGQLYFTMKLVKGRDLRRILELVARGEEGWTENRVVGVILRVCEAVAYAHSKGVLHRDIKPANVMVGRYGEAYLMDWGLARVLGREASAPGGAAIVSESGAPDSWLFSRDGRVAGTPVYMSPEQALGEVEAVDERSDIYSLGALLYHLVTGRMPYIEPGEKPLPIEVLLRARLGPPRPVRELAPEAAPGLVAICEKAMARAAEERYRSATEMAAALQDYLEDISAAREESRRQERRARLINDFLIEMLASGDPAEAQGREVSVRDVLDRAARRAAEAFPDQPLDEAALRATIGRLYRELGRYDEAGPHLEQALRLSREVRGEDHPETLLAAVELALLRRARGQLDEAEALLRATLAAQQRQWGEHHADTLRSRMLLASVLRRSHDRLAEAEELLRRVVEGRRELLGAEHPGTLAALEDLAQVLREDGRPDEAIPLQREALDGLLRVHGGRHPGTLVATNELASLLLHAGERDEAERLFRRALAGQRQVLGEHHPDTLATMNNLALLLQREGRLAPAQALLTEALEAQRRTLGADHPNTLSFANNLALVLLQQDRLGEAEDLLRDNLERAERALTPSHRYVARFRHNLGRCLARRGALVEAGTLLRAAHVALRSAVGPDHPWVVETEQALAELVASSGG